MRLRSGRQGRLAAMPADAYPYMTELSREHVLKPGYDHEMQRRRPVKGWLRVESAAVGDDELLRTWARRALSWARSLPPKQPAVT